MSILWRRGSGTVKEARKALGPELAYTSVLSVLQTLEEKGYVRHGAEGRAYRYHLSLAPEKAGWGGPAAPSCLHWNRHPA